VCQARERRLEISWLARLGWSGRSGAKSSEREEGVRCRCRWGFVRLEKR
jgi:hypothetical protein